MKTVALIAPLLLAACGAPAVATYEPYVVDVANPAALFLDKAECRARALAYSAPFDANAIATGAAQGATRNAAGAAIPPFGIVPALGAAGGATSAALSGLGVFNDDQRRAFLICLSHRGERSRAYDVIDPNQ